MDRLLDIRDSYFEGLDAAHGDYRFQDASQGGYQARQPF